VSICSSEGGFGSVCWVESNFVIPEYKLILVKIVADPNSSKSSSMVGMGKRSRMVTALSAM